jgi:cytochrome c biogenesis protein
VSLEYAGLARGEDPGLAKAVEDVALRHRGDLGADAAASTTPT